MNESRMKVYEQLEVSRVDIERNNQRLSEDTILDREKIRSLSATVQSLELQCEELQRCLDEVVLRRSSPDRERDRDSPEIVKVSGGERGSERCQVRIKVPNTKH